MMKIGITDGDVLVNSRYIISMPHLCKRGHMETFQQTRREVEELNIE